MCLQAVTQKAKLTHLQLQHLNKISLDAISLFLFYVSFVMAA